MQDARTPTGEWAVPPANSEESFRSVLLASIAGRGDDEWRNTAEAWNISFKQLSAWIGDSPKARFPAEYIVPLSHKLGHFRLLDHLEGTVGRVALILPGRPMPFAPLTLRDVLRRIIDSPEKKRDGELLAKQLGTDYRQLRYFVTRGSNRHFPAEFLVPFCRQLHDYTPLDFLESQAGRLAFPLPPLRPLGASDIADVHKLLQESLDATRTALESMEDGRIDVAEARGMISEFDILVRHCVRLRHWLTSTAF